MIFYPKDLDAGFVILCLDGNSGYLEHTLKSIRFRYGDIPCIAIVEQGTSKKQIKRMEELCPIYRGKNTVTSLINTGMRNSDNGWNMFLVAGVWLGGTEIKRMSIFVESEKDILFPVIDKAFNWENSTLNGLLMHKTSFKEVGPFIDNNTPLDMCKFIWGVEAEQRGCKFKSVLGPKII